MIHSGETRPYRIGWWTHRWWPSKLVLAGLRTGHQPDGQHVGRRQFIPLLWGRVHLLRRPHRPWQSEAPSFGCQCARRAFTPRGAEQKMLRDLHHFAERGVPSRYQRWRKWWADRPWRARP